MTTHTLAMTLVVSALAGAAMAHGPQTHRSAPLIHEQQPWGIAAESHRAQRTIAIEMGDNMRFTPEVIDVREGETVRLAIRNRGKLLHELVIGTQQALDEHAALMVKFPTMQHDEPHMAHVDPGKRGEIVWTFNRPGEFKFACLIAGHYQAGMVGTVRVQPASKGNL